MQFNNKKLERTSKLVKYLIAFVLFVFLVSLSNKLMSDMDSWEDEPQLEDYENTSLLNSYKAKIDQKELKIEQEQEKRARIETTLKTIENQYKNAESSFNNWVESRKAIGSPKQNKEITQRAKKLDGLYQIQQEWKTALLKSEQAIQALEKQKEEVWYQKKEETLRAYTQLEEAYRAYSLKVFLIRLLFILPILLLGIFFMLRFRKHTYWPLFLGFVFFSFYAFFFGLVPYLPSYGGYIRYTVGIVLSIVLGIYALNKIKTFIETKKKELAASSAERAKKLQPTIAEKALDNHMCPSCGKDFLVKTWSQSLRRKDHTTYASVTNFCRYCGLQLFKPCSNCGTQNFAHLPYCTNCGEGIEK